MSGFKLIPAVILSAFLAQASFAADVPAYINAAVADPIRPASDTERDVNRKPAEVLAFAGVKPGDTVADLLPGRGYFTKLFCKIVGEDGHVYAASQQRSGGPAGGPPGQPPAEETQGDPCNNVTELSLPADAFDLPVGLDLVWTSENYHDLYNTLSGKEGMIAFNKSIFAALKPGGVYMVEDHRAPDGTGNSATNTIHRIDPEEVIADVTAAGFVLEDKSDVLDNPDDPLDVSPFQLNGKSSKFLLKFRKPL